MSPAGRLQFALCPRSYLASGVCGSCVVLGAYCCCFLCYEEKAKFDLIQILALM